ncbi:hypothetical protein INT45_004425 [Circinella minor]|uniref:DNA polymerase delta subunit 3 n=1 Tax=Circinella minor TaxID=1195481 RepID=A0A8H7RSG7_9FUNG|nr:hypothetical protein INT45_004425 [Circinella minor]
MEDQLNITVLQEKRPVTFKSLARQHNIHVNTAKQALWDYAEKYSNVHAIYCIAGRLVVDGDKTRDTIRLVKDNDLEDMKKQFRQVTGIHVYSVIPYDPKDLSILVTANKDIPYLTIQDRVRCGVLKCSQVLTVKPSTQKRTQPDTTLSKQQQQQSLPKPTSSIPSKPTSSPSSTATTNKSTIPPKRKGTLSFEKHAKKTPTPTPVSSSPTPPPVTTKTPEKQPTPEPEKPSLTAEDIFSEDEDMAEPSPARERSPVNDDPMEMDEPLEQEQQEEEEPQSKIEEEENEPEVQHQPQPKKLTQKKRRRVMKKKHYTNERGFLVTEDVEEYETVDEDEEEEQETTRPQIVEKKQTKATAPPASGKKSGSKKAPTEQRNLFSFWGKK